MNINLDVTENIFTKAGMVLQEQNGKVALM